LAVLEGRKNELISTYSKLINKVYKRYDVNKIVKEYIRLSLGVGNNLRMKTEVINQVMTVLKE
jgi:hypothetical protein